MKYYWAYGSNLCVKNMKRRCPGAIQLEPMVLPKASLVFRLVADVEFNDYDEVHGGLWWITEEDERALDRYEGVRGGFYEKRHLIIRFGRKPEKHRVLFYQMLRTNGVMPPEDEYIERIAQGYRDFHLPMEALDRALAAAWNDKSLDEWLRSRHKKRGSPRLAKRIKSRRKK
jgi:hypothetical protein